MNTSELLQQARGETINPQRRRGKWTRFFGAFDILYLIKGWTPTEAARWVIDRESSLTETDLYALSQAFSRHRKDLGKMPNERLAEYKRQLMTEGNGQLAR